MNTIKHLSMLAALCAVLQGCIPMIVGGYIGYKMSEHDTHVEWCAQHVNDETCHP